MRKLPPGDDESVFTRVFTRICHVKTFDDRRRHIQREFSRRGVPINFYLDFDADDIRSVVDVAASKIPLPILSLAFKHRGIWQEFLASQKPYCLVFEDDVFLDKDFVAKLGLCMNELGDPSRRAVVYLGNAGNYYIPYLSLKRGRHLYPARHGRCTDSYLITRPVAEARLAWLERNGFTTAIDHQIDIMDAELGIQILWFERPIAWQGTHTGAFASSLMPETNRPQWQKRLLWFWKKSTRTFFGRMR